MSRTWRPLAAAAGAVFKRDLLLYCSHRSRVATTIFTTAVTLSVFYYLSRLVHARSVGTPDRYFAFVVVGLVGFGMLTSTLAIPVSTLRAELQTGTFERLVLSPFGAVRASASLLLFPLALSVLTGLASLLFAGVAFGLALHWSTVALALPVAVLAAAAFAPFGLAMSAGVVVFKQTNAGAGFVVTGLTLLAGVYFPVSLLPGWIAWASDVQPFTPAVDLLRHLLIGTSLHEAAAVELVTLIGFTVVGIPLALAVLRAAVEHGRRRGTVIEY